MLRFISKVMFDIDIHKALLVSLYIMGSRSLWYVFSSLFFFVSELMDLLLTGDDQSQADYPNSLAEDHPM